jgi:ABC-2 type transport system permease protein
LSQNVPELAAVARRLSVVDRFQSFTRGLIQLRDLIYFASFIFFWLFLNTLIVAHKRAD